MKTNNVLDSDDKAIIRLVAIMFHTQYIKPADRLMGPDEKMPVSLDDIIFGLIMLSHREDNPGGPLLQPPAAGFYGGVN